LIQIFLNAPLLKPAIVFIISITLLFANFFSSPHPISYGYSESIQHQIKPHTLSQSSHDNQQQQQQPNKVIEASGHFANNQIENGTVTWIQGGLWHLDIYNSTTSNPNNETSSTNNIHTANFSANFTMIKPDGSLSHEHMIKNFTSDNVILAENDIIVTGVTDIYTNNNSTLEYNQIPITVHLMGKKVLGLMIDVKKTERHFASSNELFGTLISGTGLEDTELLLQDDKNNNNLKMDEMMEIPHS
jgi:lipopolysaccharide export LptBFGC system permease protein LptF